MECFPLSIWNIFLFLIGIFSFFLIGMFSFLLTFLFEIVHFWLNRNIPLFFHDILKNLLFARGHGTVCRSCLSYYLVLTSFFASFYHNSFNQSSDDLRYVEYVDEKSSNYKYCEIKVKRRFEFGAKSCNIYAPAHLLATHLKPSKQSR